MTPEGLMKSREQKVRFTKRMKDGETVTHTARIVTYVDLNKRTPRLVSLLTNNMEMRCHEIIAIYRKRWEIELLFKLLKQGFPPCATSTARVPMPSRYRYGLQPTSCSWSYKSVSKGRGASQGWQQ